MSSEVATPIPGGLVQRLASVLGLRVTNKQTVSHRTDRMAALDDPATRRALAELPEHLLRDVGVPSMGHPTLAPDAPEGEALRRHLW